MKNEIKVKPFLKWVGGKGGLLEQLEKHIPENFNRYFEPFLGGGALFFRLQPKQAFLNDINKSLISTYQHIKLNPKEIISSLKGLENSYYSKNDEERSNFYYEIREKYNASEVGSLKRSVYLMFLNKAGYNGLYRENSTGGYNVPFGRYKNPKILDTENILEVSKLLSKTTFYHKSFYDAVKNAKKGDFVYFDPPYHPLNGTSKFTSYTEHDFNENDQIKLRDLFVELDKRGCYVMLSNSHSKFIIDLYKKYRQEVVMASRAINCKAKGRGKIKELVIMNY